MPFYEYKCQNCGEVVTLQRRVDEIDDPVQCPWCYVPVDGQQVLGSKMERQPTAASFSIRGYSAANGYSGGKK